jgi:ribosomal protein S18 acetylase RimI-like enzyme
MLLEAAYRPNAVRASREDMLADAKVGRYVMGWIRQGDSGVIAEGRDGLLGAAWYRLFSPEEPGFGFVDTETPELSIAVVRERRGEGIGSQLLAALIARAREEGHPALSLSVSPENPAASLYARFGFVRVASRDDHWTMRLDLRSQSGPRRGE